MTRRKAGYVGAMTALSYSKVMGANDKLRMGYIGLGNRGDQVHDGFLEYGDQETVAVCDLKESYMDFAVQKSRATPKKYTDYRRLLEDQNVDAVAIATPDHWHAIQFIDACRAGKDVYVEKPLSLLRKAGGWSKWRTKPSELPKWEFSAAPPKVCRRLLNSSAMAAWER